MVPGPDGDVDVRRGNDPTFRLVMSRRDFIAPFMELITAHRPSAVDRLKERFSSSSANRHFQDFLICRRYIRCNFCGIDNKWDIDENGNFNTEYILCPHTSECEDYGIVCNSNESILMPREKEVLKLIVDGYSNKEISEELFIAESTVHNHRNNMLKKLNVKNTAGLVKYWFVNCR